MLPTFKNTSVLKLKIFRELLQKAACRWNKMLSTRVEIIWYQKTNQIPISASALIWFPAPQTSTSAIFFASPGYPQKPKRSPSPTEMLDYGRPPLLPRFSFASCCNLISHLENHPARRDVFPCMWISLTSYSLLHVSHPPWLQICMWLTYGPSFMNIRALRWLSDERNTQGNLAGLFAYWVTDSMLMAQR